MLGWVLQVCFGPSLHGRARRSAPGFSQEGKPQPQVSSCPLLTSQVLPNQLSPFPRCCRLVYWLSQPCSGPCIPAAHTYRHPHTPNSQSHANTHTHTHACTPLHMHTQLTKPRQHAHTHGHTPTQLPTSIHPTHTPTCTHRCTHTHTHPHT